MKVFAVTHSERTDPGVFRDAIESAGHELEVWNMVEQERAPKVDLNDAVIVFGGDMSVGSYDENPWLRAEEVLLRELLARRVPTLGVCFGAQLLVSAVGGDVFRAPEPELGWTPVELGDAAADDPVVGALPRRFAALNWHIDTWTLPASNAAVELARSERYPQAHRVGTCAWGVQFHPEVTGPIMRRLVDREVPDDKEAARVWAEIDAGIGEWNSLGRRLCTAFVGFAAARNV